MATTAPLPTLQTPSVHLRDALVLDKVLSGLVSAELSPAPSIDADTELALAQQVVSASLSMGRHRTERAQQLNWRNVAWALGWSATVPTAFIFFYNILNLAKP